MKKRVYPAIVEKEESSDYGVFFPDFPGCISAGETYEEALEMAHEALQFHIDGLLEDKTAIPEATNLSDIRQQDGAAVMLVSVKLPGKNKKLSITLDEHLLDEIDSVAGNRSGFLAEAAREKLAKHAG